MNEILPGVHHWVTHHENIDADVHSYFLELGDRGVLIDPRVPGEGLEWFRGRASEPTDALLTNRHHYRNADRFREEFGVEVWCHEAGMHEFTHGEEVTPFSPGDPLPGGVEAVPIGSLCPEETAYLVDWEDGVAAIGDAVVVWNGGGLTFVPDQHMGDDPIAVRKGLWAALSSLVERDWKHLLLAHGEPIPDRGRDTLREFLERAAGE